MAENVSLVPKSAILDLLDLQGLLPASHGYTFPSVIECAENGRVWKDGLLLLEGNRPVSVSVSRRDLL